MTKGSSDRPQPPEGDELAGLLGRSTAILDAIDSALKYPEGRGVWLAVRSKKEMEGVQQLAHIKMAN